MSTFILIVHILLCIALILFVLLQQGKGADAGAITGGNADSILGAGGKGTFISRLTTGTAIAFMVTSIVLVYHARTAMTFNTATQSQEVDVLQGSVMDGVLPVAPIDLKKEDIEVVEEEAVEVVTATPEQPVATVSE